MCRSVHPSVGDAYESVDFFFLVTSGPREELLLVPRTKPCITDTRWRNDQSVFYVFFFYTPIVSAVILFFLLQLESVAEISIDMF